MANPVVIVVGTDEGGVGKTTISRTRLDYLEATLLVPSTQIAARNNKALSS